MPNKDNRKIFLLLSNFLSTKKNAEINIKNIPKNSLNPLPINHLKFSPKKNIKIVMPPIIEKNLETLYLINKFIVINDVKKTIHKSANLKTNDDFPKITWNIAITYLIAGLW